IVAGGDNGASLYNNHHAVLARYEEDGSVDTGFGSGGVVTGVRGGDLPTGVPLVDQGGAQGGALPPPAPQSAVVLPAPLLTDGSLDRSYGSSGRTEIGNVAARGAVADGDGIIVGAGGLLFRLGADGAPDASFAPCVVAYDPHVAVTGLFSGFDYQPVLRMGL